MNSTEKVYKENNDQWRSDREKIISFGSLFKDVCIDNFWIIY